MNFILYVHDYGPEPVWPYGPGVVEQVQREINELVSDYTMGRVTVDVQAEAAALQDRVAELEDLLAADTDQWHDARNIVASLVRNWENGDIAGYVNELRMEFGLNTEGNLA